MEKHNQITGEITYFQKQYQSRLKVELIKYEKKFADVQIGLDNQLEFIDAFGRKRDYQLQPGDTICIFLDNQWLKSYMF